MAAIKYAQLLELLPQEEIEDKSIRRGAKTAPENDTIAISVQLIVKQLQICNLVLFSMVCFFLHPLL